MTAVVLEIDGVIGLEHIELNVSGSYVYEADFGGEKLPKLLEHLNELKKEIDDYNNVVGASSDDIITAAAKKSLFSFVYDRKEMTHFATEISKELNLENNRNEFEKDKNRLITLMAKNNNIYSKLNGKKMNFYIFLGVLILYTIGILFIYVQEGIVEKEMQAMLLIGLSLTVLIIFAIVDIYQMATSRHYESFNTDGWDNEKTNEWDEVIDGSSDFETKINTMISTFVTNLPNIVKYNTHLRNDETNQTKREVISSILHDFNNKNYVNMRRYQMTDYKINETRSNMHFVKYAFLLVSTIGLLAGLHLRTELGPATTYLPVSKTVLTSIAFILIMTFLFIYFMHKKQNMMRKKYNWNKLYWNVKETHNAQGNYLYM